MITHQRIVEALAFGGRIGDRGPTHYQALVFDTCQILERLEFSDKGRADAELRFASELEKYWCALGSMRWSCGACWP